MNVKSGANLQLNSSQISDNRFGMCSAQSSFSNSGWLPSQQFTIAQQFLNPLIFPPNPVSKLSFVNQFAYLIS